MLLAKALRMFRQTGATMTTRWNPAKFQLACRTGAVLLGLLAPAGGHAAPFCIGTEALPPQCIYYDANSCHKEAGRQGGICSVNKKELRVTRNVGQYCLVTSQKVSLCIYSDRATCSAEAQRQHAACTYAPGVAPSGAPDPYAGLGGE
jgi:hypothetical protein